MDEFRFNPRSTLSSSTGPASSLADRFEADQRWQNFGNTSLTYKPVTQSQMRKQLQAEQESANRAAAAAAAAAAAPAPTAAATTASAPVLVFATAAASVGYYDASGQYQSLGYKGLAVLHSPTYPNSPALAEQPGSAPQYTLICYDPHTQQQDIVAPINEYFTLVLQESNYCSFYDSRQIYWSLQVGAPELQRQLALHVGLARFAALQARALAISQFSQGTETPAAALARVYAGVVAALASNAGASAKASAGALSSVLFQELSVTPPEGSALPLADGDSAKIFYECFASDQFVTANATATTAGSDATAEYPDFGVAASRLAPGFGTPVDTTLQKARAITLGSGKDSKLEPGLRGLSRGTRRLIFTPPLPGTTQCLAYVVHISKTRHVSAVESVPAEIPEKTTTVESKPEPQPEVPTNITQSITEGDDVPTELAQKQALVARMARMSSAGGGSTPMLAAALRGNATPQFGARSAPVETPNESTPIKPMADLNLAADSAPQASSASETPAPFSYSMSSSSASATSATPTPTAAQSSVSVSTSAQLGDITQQLMKLVQASTFASGQSTSNSVPSDAIMSALNRIQEQQNQQHDLLISLKSSIVDITASQTPRTRSSDGTISAGELAAAVHRLAEERTELVEELERRAKRIADLKKDLERSVIADDETQDQLRDARIEARKLQTRIKELEYKLALAEEGDLSHTSIQHAEEIKRLNADLVAAKREATEAAHLSKQVASLQSQLQEAQARADQSRAEALQNANSRQLLERENEQLKAQLQALQSAKQTQSVQAMALAQQPSQEMTVSIVEDVLKKVYLDAMTTLAEAEVTPIDVVQSALRAVVRRVRREVLEGREAESMSAPVGSPETVTATETASPVEIQTALQPQPETTEAASEVTEIQTAETETKEEVAEESSTLPEIAEIVEPVGQVCEVAELESSAIAEANAGGAGEATEKRKKKGKKPK